MIVKKTLPIIFLMYKEGSDRFHRGLMEIIPVIIERGLIDLVGV